MKSESWWARAGLVLLWLAVLAMPASASAGLAAELGEGVEVARQDESGVVGFIGTEPGEALESGASASASPASSARAFIEDHAEEFGVAGAATGLTVVDTNRAAGGATAVRLTQTADGLPVLGGQLVVNLDRSGDVLSVLGETSPSPEPALEPEVTAAEATDAAVGLVARVHDAEPGELAASKPALQIYDPRLLGAPGPIQEARLAWALEVSAEELAPIRELVVVDAALGAVTLHFNQVTEARNRSVCWANNDSTPPAGKGIPCTDPDRTEGMPGPDPDADITFAYDYSGDTYDFYLSRFGRDSLNGAGMPLISTVDYCPPLTTCPPGSTYRNAFWTGQQMAYGDGFASADDVVGHELTHGVTEFSSNLFYYYQSGAINESISDVFGEFVDLTNGAGSDAGALRWQVGEDLPGGVIRYMNHPPADNDPDRTQSPLYRFTEADNGGVHANSGVNNKAAFLLTDGGSFNGQTVTGLGLEKVARLYYEVNNSMLISGSDYNDLANALRAACANLAGAGVAGFTTDDCVQVDAAVVATEMDLTPMTAPEHRAATCVDPAFVNVDTFFDNLENPGSGNWVTSAPDPPDRWSYPPIPGFTYATSGVYNFRGGNGTVPSDSSIAMTTPVTVPDAGFLHFAHAYGFQDSAGTPTDGGVLEYSTDGGASWQDAGSRIEDNGYTGVIAPAANPLAGREAFVNESNGYIASRVNLTDLAGQSILIRFRIGTDNTSIPLVFDPGWFIDDIRIYSCADTTPNTRIRKLKAKRTSGKRSSAKARFTGTSPLGRPLGFQCKIDRKRYRACDSPEKFRRLKAKKRHKLKVRAYDLGTGAADLTPAKKKFRIKRRR